MKWLHLNAIAMWIAFATATASAAAPKLDVPYVPTSEETVETMLRMANVGPKDLVYDLGCGDGRIVVMAAKKFGARGVGIDIDPERIQEANENARNAGVSDRVKFIEQDLFKTDFSKATVLTMYLLPDVNLKLRPTVLNELRPGTRVVSHSFSMEEWEADKTDNGSEYPQVYFWIVPANLTGEWTWTSPGAGGKPNEFRLKVDQAFQNFTGTIENNASSIPLSNGKITGDQVEFVAEQDMQGKRMPMHFQGLVDGNTIRGTVQSAATAQPSGSGAQPWTAKRDPATIVALDNYKGTRLAATQPTQPVPQVAAR